MKAFAQRPNNAIPLTGRRLVHQNDIILLPTCKMD
jgi:hypothetical protein